MVLENTKLFLKLYYRPLAAMGGIIDEGSWFFGALAVVAVSAMLLTTASRIYSTYEAVPMPIGPHQRESAREVRPAAGLGADEVRTVQGGDEYEPPPRVIMRSVPLPVVGRLGWWFLSFAPGSVLTSVLVLALLYVPGTLLVVTVLERAGSFGVAFRRDYGPLLACTFMAWAASHLPFAIVGLALDQNGRLDGPTAFLLWMLAALYFGVLMVFAVRTVCGVGYATAMAAAGVAWMSLALHRLIYILASPFLLFYAYMFLRGDLGDVTSAFSQRQSFRRNLEASTVNPRDAEAHYQLGLVYQNRRQYTEAIARFKRAVEIDAREVDASFQLGRIAREQGRLQEAIEHFGAVVEQDDKHAQSEIWREIGATYLAASMLGEARGALETYVERRAYDVEGLYYLGEVYRRLGEDRKAAELYTRCVEAARTTPYYHRGQTRKWAKLAGDQLRAVGRAEA